MPLTDTLIVILIVLTIILLVWSRIMQQTMLDTLNELRDFVKGAAIKDG